MRAFRVFNRVTKVPVIWKLAGFRLGGIGQIAMLSVMALGVALILTVGFIAALTAFVMGFATVGGFSMLITRLDPDEALSELTALCLLGWGMRHRYSANFDLPGI